jgi:GTPase SAR1 family protein
MGCVASSSMNELDLELLRDQETEAKVHRLLLLGTGEAGKSSIFKNMITSYGKGFSEAERRDWRIKIYHNLVENMKVLLDRYQYYSQDKAGADESHSGRLTNVLSEGASKLGEEVKAVQADENLDVRILDAIAEIWSEAAIQEVYQFRSEYQLADSVDYFFDSRKINELKSLTYLPTVADILRAREQTTGVHSTDFEINGTSFRMVDVGGQRSERKKWIPCFQGVTAVVFIAAISSYDQVIREDDKTNRMVETLALYDLILNSSWFRECSIILFLNKVDLFKEKITRVPLTVCWGEYKGGSSYEETIKFIESQFHAQRKQGTPEKKVYVHVTCAVDTDQIKKIFLDVRDVILKESLSSAHILV